MSQVRVRLLFVDDGSYHNETVRIPADALEGHERLIDVIREDQQVLRQIHVDVDRLCSAWLLEDDEED